MANIRDIVGMGIDDTNNLVCSWYATARLSMTSLRPDPD